VFFPLPGEKVGEIFEVEVLTATEGLKVQAIENFVDDSTGKPISRTAGESWIIPGPREYWLPMHVKKVKRVNAVFTVGEYSYFGFK